MFCLKKIPFSTTDSQTYDKTESVDVKSVYATSAGYHLVGFVTIDLDSSCGEHLDYGYEIATLYIQEYFQGKGIGTGLLKYVATLFGPKQWLTTWIYNAQAIGFYQHQGFKTVGHTYFDLDGEKHKNLISGKGCRRNLEP